MKLKHAYIPVLMTLFFCLFGFSVLSTYAEEIEPVVEQNEEENDPDVSVSAHVATVGWQDPVGENETAGTEGRGLAMEALTINLVDCEYEGDVEYRSHIANVGWEEEWTNDISGTTGKGLPMEAVEIRLTGEVSDYYDIYYRSHIANIGWTGWTDNGKATGSQGHGYSLQALQVQLLKKEEVGPEDNKQAFYGNQISVQTHVSNIGWMSPVTEDSIAGTTGQSRCVEALIVDTSGMLYDGDLQCSAYVQGIGWQDYVSGKEIAGTVGKAKRIEAIRMVLTGEMAEVYDIYYQSHVSYIGWMDWACNGEKSGTTGYNYSLEALQVKLVEKGVSFDRPTDNPFQSNGLSYTAHVSYIGWQDTVTDGKMAGTTGSSHSIEALQITLGELSQDGGIEYQTHISNVGWESDWSKNGEISGTVGRSQAIQAIRIVLTGNLTERYEIYYRTHISNYGWLDWTSGGNTSGSEGLGNAIEAIEITLDPKKIEDSPNTIGHFIQENGVVYVDRNGEPLYGWQTTNNEGRYFANTDSSLNYAAVYNTRGIPTFYIDLITVSHVTLDSGLKITKYPGQSVSIFDGENEEYCFSIGNVEIKGRGNSTWSVDKKPYQIKFDSKTSLLGLPEAKKWVLLANYFDDTGLRNAAAADLAEAMELDSYQYAFVDLYIEGSYRGNYLLTQKIDIGKNMVPLKDEKGVLMEVDSSNIDPDEIYITSDKGVNIVMKEAVIDEDPDVLNASLHSFLTIYNALEYSVNHHLWDMVQEYADVESFAKYYLLNELATNPDGILSSFYLYKDGDQDVIHAGPIWDFDIGFGNPEGFGSTGWEPRKLYILNSKNYTSRNSNYADFFYQLMRIPEFYNLVCDIWQNTLYEAALEESDQIDSYYTYLYQSKADDNAIWRHQNVEYQTSYLKTWFKERTEFLNMIYGKGYTEAGAVQLGNSTFTLTHLGEGWYTIHSADGVFTISESFKDVHSIGIRPYSGDYSQQWHIVEIEGRFKLVNKATGHVLEYRPEGIVASIDSKSGAKWHTVIPL